MNGAAQLVKESLRPLVDLVYPPRCPNCGDAIAEQSGLCMPCWNLLVIPGGPACSACQRPLRSRSDDVGTICAVCMADAPLHNGIAAGTLYNETSRKLVLAFKHGRKIALAQMLARLVAAKLPEPKPGTVIVPVPLHRWRLWQRGYNQAALLGRELEKAGKGSLVVDALVRTKPTPPLGGLGAKARARTLSGAIALTQRGRSAIETNDIVLVDDVLTSGATSEACVRVLKRGGARKVTIACFARVLDEAMDAVPPPNETPETAKVPGAT